jgi:oligopeptidase B
MVLFIESFLLNNTIVKAPIAEKIPTEMTMHGDSRVDNYFWMRLSDEQKEAKNKDNQTKKVEDYLEAENHFLDVNMSDTDELQSKLFDEYVSRIKQDDSSVPYLKNGYIYSSKYEKGDDYRRYYRKKNIEESKEELFLDLPKLANNQKYFSLGDWSISTNNEILAYSSDLVSRREYTIYFKDLITEEILEDKIENTTGGITWANDNKTVFYVKKDEQTLRSHKIFKHILGTDSSDDELVFEEKDETYSCYVYKSKSNKYLFIALDL